jgi:hypothetical protein
MGLGLLSGSISLCNPPEEAIGFFTPFIQSQLQTITATFPDQIALVPGNESGTPNDPRLRLQWVRSGIVFSVWWGWPLLITGGLAALIALVGSPAIGGILQLIIQIYGAAFLPPLLASTIGETASAVARQMLVPVILQGFVLAVIGLMMIIVGILLGKRERIIVVR